MHILLHQLSEVKVRQIAAVMRACPSARLFTTLDVQDPALRSWVQYVPVEKSNVASLSRALQAHAIDVFIQHTPQSTPASFRGIVLCAKECTRNRLDELISEPVRPVSRRTSAHGTAPTTNSESKANALSAPVKPDQPSSVPPALPSNPKEAFRVLCMNAIEASREWAVPSALKKGLKKEVVFVEFRWLPHVEVLLRNAIRWLGDAWSYTVVCGQANHVRMRAMCTAIHPQIRIIVLDKQESSQNEYNDLLLTADFWTQFRGETLLLMQEDTYMFHGDIEPFLPYDYVGGAFAPDTVSPVNQGNGGFSLRSKAAMLRALKAVSPADFTTTSETVNNYRRRSQLTHYPEDVYFSQTLQTHQLGEVAPYDLARKFSSEQVYTRGSMGMHCMWFCCRDWKTLVAQSLQQTQPTASRRNPKAAMSVVQSLRRQPPHTTVTDAPSADGAGERGCGGVQRVFMIHSPAFADRDHLVTAMRTAIGQSMPDSAFQLIEDTDSRSCSLDPSAQLSWLRAREPRIEFADPSQFVFYKPGQIGCYLGHLLAVRRIATAANKQGFSLILEDDAVFARPGNWAKEVDCALRDTLGDFDVMYLGLLNRHDGTPVVPRSTVFVPNARDHLFGTHAILVRNDRAPALYRHLCSIRHEIDTQYRLLMNEGRIQVRYVHPSIVKQNRQLPSRIGWG